VSRPAREPDPAILGELIALLEALQKEPNQPIPPLNPAQLSLLRTLVGENPVEAARNAAEKKRKSKRKK